MNDRQRLKTFPGLTASDFQHPWDMKATESLKSIPGFDLLCQKIMEYGFERAYYLQNTADNVRVTPRMFPRLSQYLEWGCGVLDIDMPEMYVSMDPYPNAFTYGQTKPFITITSGLLELLSEKERYYVVGHELGHIKCEHVLYTMVANNISNILSVIGEMTLGLGRLLGAGLALALYDWKRKAELSADRAGLLSCQDRNIAMDVFMKLAGGTSAIVAQMDHREFLKQIRAYEDADVSTLNRAYKALLTAFRSHPFPIMRAKHLDAWIESGEYQEVSGIPPDPPRGHLPSGEE